jgi:hypothetical protein
MPLKFKKGKLVLDKNYIQANLFKVYKTLIQKKNLRRSLRVGANRGWYLSEQAIDNGFSSPDISVVDVISSIPRVSGIDGNYSYEVLHKNDVDNYVVGHYTNCCQHLDGVGSNCVKNVAQYEWASTVVLRHRGEIIATSFLWHNKGVIIFDNIEAKVNSDTREAVSRAYKHIIDAYSDMGFNVIVGTGYGDDLDLGIILPGSTKVPYNVLETLRRDEIQYSDADNALGHQNNKPWYCNTERIKEIIDNQQVVIDFERIYGNVYEAQLTICSEATSPDDVSDSEISGNGSIAGLIVAKKIIKGWEAKHPEAHLIIEGSDAKRASAYRRLRFTQMSSHLYINRPWYVNNNVLTSFNLNKGVDKEDGDSVLKDRVITSLGRLDSYFYNSDYDLYSYTELFPSEMKEEILEYTTIESVLYRKRMIDVDTFNARGRISQHVRLFRKRCAVLDKYAQVITNGSLFLFINRTASDCVMNFVDTVLFGDFELVKRFTKKFFSQPIEEYPAFHYCEGLDEIESL